MMSLEQRIRVIEERNERVEASKAWETSWTRRFLIFFFTYLALGFYLLVVGVDRWWLHAIVPAVGFMLSTLTLPACKAWWLRRRR